MVPCQSLQWSWCQLRSHLAAPTKVGVSPALSSGFSRWCQVVTVMESQHRVKPNSCCSGHMEPSGIQTRTVVLGYGPSHLLPPR